MMKMTMREFSEATGVPFRTIRFYCDNSDTGARLFPHKGDNPLCGNHRCFGKAELDRMEQILIYQKLGLSLREIREVLNKPGYDRHEALHDAIGALKRKIKHLQNLEMLANAALAMGTTFYSWGAFDDEAIDEIAEAVDKNPVMRSIVENGRSATEEDAVQLFEGIMSLVPKFVGCYDFSDPDALAKMSEAVDEYFEMTSGYMPPRGIAALFQNGLLFTGNGLMRAEVERRYGESAAKDVAGAFLFTWAVEASKVFDPIVFALSQSQQASPERSQALEDLKRAVVEHIAYEQADDPVAAFDENASEYIGAAEFELEKLVIINNPDDDLRTDMGLGHSAAEASEAYKAALEILKADARERNELH